MVEEEVEEEEGALFLRAARSSFRRCLSAFPPSDFSHRRRQFDSEAGPDNRGASVRTAAANPLSKCKLRFCPCCWLAAVLQKQLNKAN